MSSVLQISTKASGHSNTEDIRDEDSYVSARIQKMLQCQSKFASQLDFEIAASKDHWTELDSQKPQQLEVKLKISRSRRFAISKLKRPCVDVAIEASKEDLQLFETLKKQAPDFFHNWDCRYILGEKLGEGRQAEIFDMEALQCCVGRKSIGGFMVAKVFKQGPNSSSLQGLLKDLQALLRNMEALPPHLSHLVKHGFPEIPAVCSIWGASLMKDGRLALAMRNHWGDLRKLIDLRMQRNRNQCTPFTDAEAKWVIYMVAVGMRGLHKLGIVHKDIKASNVLVDSISPCPEPASEGLLERPQIQSPGRQAHPTSEDSLQRRQNQPTVNKLVQAGVNGKFKCFLSDYECSSEIVGTRFWRAPEILLALKLRRNDHVNAKVAFTQEADVYSFAMMCYEILTGCIPFEDIQEDDFDVVLGGRRPPLEHQHIEPCLKELLTRCWQPEPSRRPTSQEIVVSLESLGYQDMLRSL